MSLKAECTFLTLRRGRAAFAMLAWLALGVFAPTWLLAQDAPVATPKADEQTAGERVQAVTDELLRRFNFGPDLSPQTLFKILHGDWANFSPDLNAGDVPAGPSEMRCSFNKMHFEQPDPGYPIFEGWIGREGARRFEVRLSVGAAFYWISNVQDEMQILGFDNSTDTGAMRLQRGLVMQRSVRQGVIFPLNNDVLSVVSATDPFNASFLVRCPSAPEDPARSARNIQLVNTVKKKMAQQAAFLSYGADGSVPFVTKMLGAWTLVDERARSDVRNRTVSDLCHTRRIEMRAEYQPLPILTAHVVDTSSPKDRPVPKAQDEFELRLAGDRELLRVPLHDPMLDVKQNPEGLHVPPIAKADMVAERQRKEAIAWYRQVALSSALPVTLIPIDDDTLVESATSAWGKAPESYGTGIAVFKRYWLRCPP
ncbi:hypothetical protein G6L29_02960 [Agrobacterium rhizogenes]|jgi:hypothetical protein|uniref:hypothetical protein n=1 Tax=Rhizobium rhizogenes TaxID=359 RepID=UPI000DE042CE|nr:hypothetical protein [Rhizobium rhizogenes]NTG72406.1 hypothetical protein [Rhizobium rhizogenes]NTG85102.1 hypothetical protein [Rhizobium rhizogenes]NTH17437.1 hypothetical protein [Rhizobium rhizogenes]NTH30410.1 hypothetical protein [Rhizobium rhizogenes]NTI14591.1 hypothetical protein [Rhizobium rhizogenes]